MNKIRSLIHKFWQGRLNAEEAENLDRLLQHDDGELRKALCERYEKFSPEDRHAINNEREAVILKKLLARIDRQEGKKGKVISLKRSVVWWAAASVILAVVALHLFRSGERFGIKSGTVITARLNKDSVLLKVVRNSSAGNMELTMADNSIVTLYPNSAISYYKLFSKTARNISITGKALFTVAKDKSRPFTVYAGGIATTALGTRFTVNTFTKDQVEVKLFEGKVVVRPSGNKLDASKEVYLLPGELVTMNNITRSFAISKFSNSNASGSHKVKNSGIADNIQFQFNNEPIASVFEKLSIKYNTRINYVQSEIAGLYFSGSVLKTDNLEAILQIISNMNGFRYEEAGGSIFIKK